MDSFLHWLILVIAVAIGWWLGRHHIARLPDGTTAGPALKERLKFLFSNYSDEAIGSFVRALPVNLDTLAMHLSIGAHFRDKGEMDRAIIIHQNLLSRTDLPHRFSDQITLELAQDYLGAGLLDRAEALLQPLLGSPESGRQAAENLIGLYQQEREWDKARRVAQTLATGVNDPILVKQIAYLSCELACEAIKSNDLRTARLRIQEALQQDPGCVRASLLSADVSFSECKYAEAQNALLKVFEQNADFGSETLEMLQRIAFAQKNERQLLDRLRRLYALWPGTSLLLALASQVQRFEGAAAAAALLRDALKDRPSMRGLLRLIDLTGLGQLSATDDADLAGHVGAILLSNKPLYQCNHCGFSGRQLHWLCPCCKRWETVTPLRGIEGE